MAKDRQKTVLGVQGGAPNPVGFLFPFTRISGTLKMSKERALGRWPLPIDSSGSRWEQPADREGSVMRLPRAALLAFAVLVCFGMVLFRRSLSPPASALDLPVDLDGDGVVGGQSLSGDDSQVAPGVAG